MYLYALYIESFHHVKQEDNSFLKFESKDHFYLIDHLITLPLYPKIHPHIFNKLISPYNFELQQIHFQPNKPSIFPFPKTEFYNFFFHFFHLQLLNPFEFPFYCQSFIPFSKKLYKTNIKILLFLTNMF